LPIFVRLGSLGGAGLLQGIKSQLGSLGAYYEDLLRENRLLFLLDGLNEMTTAHREANLREIRDLLGYCRKQNLLMAVTCRELDYTGALDLDLPGRVTIQPLDPLRIQRFVNAYIDEPGKGDELFLQIADVQDIWKKWEQAGASLQLFWTAKDIPRENPNVFNRTTSEDDRRWRALVHKQTVGARSMMALAANPYMLYMITQVFTQAGALPPNRGLLFQTFIDYLLEKRERLTAAQASELKARLSELAYAMQAQGGGTAFTSLQLMKSLQDEQALYQARSASLLAGGDDQVRFTHQLLQEYFAAHRLQILLQSTKAETLFPSEKWWKPQGWEETLILLAGLYSDDCAPVVEWLAEAQPEVAARCITESGAYYPPEKSTGLRERWTPRLTDLKRDLSPQARAAVGRALGRLRLGDAPLDNRKGVSVISVAGMALPDIDWVEIPAGEFIYQKKEKRFEPTFCMARYPVTFAQFQTFLDDPQGFANPEWWQGLSADDDHRRAPGEQAFKFGNHPRENASWYDAIAFCCWLTDQARQYPELLPGKLAGQTGWSLGLPTEWEWEKAARGPSGLEYPYGKTFDSSKGNTRETRIGQTSAVGVFPQGASPYGVLDLSGNVWEWCLNERGKPQNIGLGGTSLRVLRGGAWLFHLDLASAAYRDNFNPDNRNPNAGFRVVVRPPSL
jgi:formylglycine-generating enzyme required for sulfatase activity